MTRRVLSTLNQRTSISARNLGGMVVLALSGFGYRAALLFGCLSVITGCGKEIEPQVVLLATVDQETAAPILSAFYRSQEGKIQPDAKFGIDLQSGNIDSASRPLGDVVWSDNLFDLLELQRRGELMPHAWNQDPGYPREMIGEQRQWCAFSAAARVLMINTQIVKDPTQAPQTIDELADVRWKDACAIARFASPSQQTNPEPPSPSAELHAAAIVHVKGEEQGLAWLGKVAGNAKVLSSDAQVAGTVAAGTVAWGVTDSNYAIAAIESGKPVEIIFPDQGTADVGCVRIPQAVAILARAENPNAAARLADYLVLPITQDRLAMGEMALIPLSPRSEYRPRILGEKRVRWAQINYEAAEKAWQKVKPKIPGDWFRSGPDD